MSECIKTLLCLRVDRRTVTSLEYGFIAATIAVVALRGFYTLMTNLSTKVTTLGVKLT